MALFQSINTPLPPEAPSHSMTDSLSSRLLPEAKNLGSESSWYTSITYWWTTTYGPSMLGFIDQLLLSIGNFGIGFLLIQHASKESFGLYGLGFASILFLIGLANATITTQMSVLAPEKSKLEQGSFCLSLLWGQFLVFIPLVALWSLVMIVLSSTGIFSDSTSFFLTIIPISAGGVLLHEFFRRFFYLKFRPVTVLLIDGLQIVGLFSSLFAIREWWDLEWHIAAIIAYGLTSLLSGTIAFLLSGLTIATSNVSILKALQETWDQGRWGLGGVTVTWTQTHGYQYLLGWLVGIGGVAEANAARLILSPVGMLSTSFNKVFLSRLVVLKHKGETIRLFKIAKTFLYLLLSFIAFYAFTIYFTKDWITHHLFTKEYQHLDLLVGAWILFFICLASRMNASLLLQVYKHFRLITIANTWTALLVLLGSIVLIFHFGILGGIASLIVGEMILSILLWGSLRHVKHHG